MTRRNPPDAQYSHKLGSGAFSAAYGRPDLGDYYVFGGQRVAGGSMAVQAITARKPSGLVDYSKTILVLAREYLAEDLRAQAYLPEIRPLRIDYANKNRPELVYTMPVYRAWLQGGKALASPVTRALFHALERDRSTGETTFDVVERKFLRAVAKETDPDVLVEVDAVSAALRAIHDARKVFRLSEYRSDMHELNLAVDEAGHLILLDPLVAYGNWKTIEEFWIERGWNATPESRALSRTTAGGSGKFQTLRELAAAGATEVPEYTFRDPKDLTEDKQDELLLAYLGEVAPLGRAASQEALDDVAFRLYNNLWIQGLVIQKRWEAVGIQAMPLARALDAVYEALVRTGGRVPRTVLDEIDALRKQGGQTQVSRRQQKRS